MKWILCLLTMAVLLGLAPPPAEAKDEREYPVGGVVYKKMKGVTAKHVTETSGENAEIKFNYFICIQRDPRSDRHADNWLTYRHCWETTKEVFEAVEVCDLFIVKDPQIQDQATRPSDKTFAKKRRQEAVAIRQLHDCD